MSDATVKSGWDVESDYCSKQAYLSRDTLRRINPFLCQLMGKFNHQRQSLKAEKRVSQIYQRFAA